ncbi:MAG: hypothetical protein KME31_08560 [Tolypothrix carrinoi HA7290-LM1]|jgi:hypothetical protein|nr:hypothetical protein [Tolypothrix carrinoi HA7290-LM1]
MQFARIWRKHGSQIIFGCLIAASLAYSSKDIARNMLALSQVRQIIAFNSQQQALLEQQFAYEKAQASVAAARYKAGCTIVVAANSPKNLATLVEGESVLDRTTKKPLPAGTVVCDGNGQTGVIVRNSQKQLVVGQMAFTGDRTLALKQIRKIHGAKVYYVTPEK